MTASISTQSSPRITPFLMFKENCVEAAEYYVNIFEHSSIVHSDEMSVSFILEGQKFSAYNGGSHFSFNEGISLFVHCDSQREVDHYWQALTADGGAESQCGWLRDKYGISWQIIPSILMELLSHPDKERANKAVQAMLTMQKIDIKALQDAVNE